MQFINPPPSFPPYFVSSYTCAMAKEVVKWANHEYNARLKYCAERGYFKEHKVLTRDYSPARIAFQIPLFNRLCAEFSNREDLWDKLSRAERRFFSDAYEFMRLLQ
jgi:hypothetical protein